MDFDKINEKEILDKIHRHISGNAQDAPLVEQSGILDHLNDNVLHSLGALRPFKDPSSLPQDTRFRFFKRVIQRFMRPFTRGQVEYNRIALEILNGLTGNFQQFLHLYQLNLDQRNQRVDHLLSSLENQIRSLEEARDNLIRKTDENHEKLTGQIETAKSDLSQDLDRVKNELSTRGDQITKDLLTRIEQIQNNLLSQMRDGSSLLHARIDDEKKAIYSALESLKTNLRHEVAVEKESLHDKISHVLQSLHQRIDDEKKAIYESTPGFKFIEDKIQETKDHSGKLAELLDQELKAVKSGFNADKESLHDRISQVLQSLHQRIDDEKKAIYESTPGIKFIEDKIQETKDHSGKLAELLDRELKDVKGRLNPAEIYRLYQEQNNLTDEIYFELEKNFRGTDESISERQDFYRNLLSSHHAEMKDKDGYYLDVGCGRGEFLNLLRNNDIPARGVDVNQKMVEKCLDMDLTVYKQEAISFLKSLPDEELRGAIALQVIEHLSIKHLFELFYLIHQKLKPGGAFVLETINPESAYAMRWFYLDYTHNKPLPAPLVQFFLYMAGFQQAEVIHRSPVEGYKQMAVTGNRDILDENFHKLNNFLFGYQDYAIRAIK